MELSKYAFVKKMRVDRFLHFRFAFVMSLKTKNDLMVHTKLLGGLEWPTLVVECQFLRFRGQDQSFDKQFRGMEPFLIEERSG